MVTPMNHGFVGANASSGNRGGANNDATAPMSHQCFNMNNSSPPRSGTIQVHPRRSPRLIHLYQGRNQHLSPSASTILFPNNNYFNHNNSVMSSCSATSYYTTTSLGTNASGCDSGSHGCDLGSHPLTLFDSSTIASAHTNATDTGFNDNGSESGGEALFLGTASQSLRVGTSVVSESTGAKPKANNNRKNVFKSFIRDELRRCICIKCLSILYSKNPMKQVDQFQFCHDLFHGCKLIRMVILLLEEYQSKITLH
jgi:hypothetical protein